MTTEKRNRTAIVFTVVFLFGAGAGTAYLLNSKRVLTTRTLLGSFLTYGLCAIGITAWFMRDGYSSTAFMWAIATSIGTGLAGASAPDVLSRIMKAGANDNGKAK